MSRCLCVLASSLVLAACGGSGGGSPTVVVKVRPQTTSTAAPATTSTPTPPPPPKPAPSPPHPQLLPAALGTGLTGFVPAVRWLGHTAVWIARTAAGVSLLAFDQRWVTLRLHSGTIDAGALGWRYGPSIGGDELSHLVAAFNGGFRFSTGVGGFMAYGRVGSPIQDGLASIVTYTNGFTDIGSWHKGVPTPGRRVAFLRQNLNLLIDHGVPASNIDCHSCWGATLGGVANPARSALGITADDRLVWAGGEHLTVPQLVGALHGAHVLRAVELDINPQWVAGYLYRHRGGHGPVAPVPSVPDQNGIPGKFLSPWSRDFFAVVVR